jgi:hypothetical protein
MIKPKNNLGIDYLSQWKPCLLPNEPSGITPDYEERIENPSEWIYSIKRDGGRVEIIANGDLLDYDAKEPAMFDFPAYSRELKLIPSVNIQEMVREFNSKSNHLGIIEAELYSEEMNRSEIMHFFRSEDVTSNKKIKAYTRLWEKTKQGTVEIFKGKEYPLGTHIGLEGKIAVKWGYPGRSVEWLTSWHDSLKLYVFDHYLSDLDKRGKFDRYKGLVKMFKNGLPNAELLVQHEFEHVDNMYQAFDQAMLDEEEGLVVIRKDAKYKSGRYSIASGQGYKVVNSNKEWEGVVTAIEESTVVKKGVEKTVNAFGRSKTSKLKTDREESGMAKGLQVTMDNGNVLTVSFNGYNHAERKELFENQELLLGKRIKFTGKLPVSSRNDAVPSQCHFTKGNTV